MSTTTLNQASDTDSNRPSERGSNKAPNRTSSGPTSSTSNGVPRRSDVGPLRTEGLLARWRGRRQIERSSSRIGLAVLALALLVFFELHVGGFVTSGNFLQIATSVAPTLLAAIPAARLVIAGNVDLSIAGGYGLMGVVCAKLLSGTGSPIVAVVGTIAAGALMGALNGTLVQRLRISPIIVTLALGSVYFASGLLFTNGEPLGNFPSSFTDLALTTVFGISVPVLVALLVFLVGAFALTKTVAGMHSYAIGGSAEAARLSGIKVSRHVLLLYVYMGASVGLLAVVTNINVASASPNNGVGFEISVLTAVILGGVAFQGGAGRPSGIFIGVATIGILQAGFVYEGLNNYWQQLAQGLLLLTALAADQIASAYRHRTRNPADQSTRDQSVPERALTDQSPVDEAVRELPTDLATEPARADAATRAEPTSAPATLQARGLAKSYGPVKAAKDITLTARAGQVTCLLGDNGAGKSTLIKMLSGVISPDTGTISLQGREQAFTGPSDARAAGIETVYQELALCTNLGAALNLVLGAEPRRFGLLDLRAAEGVARERLAALGTTLEDHFRPVAELSGGQRQSVAIARVVVDEVKVVVLDEPTAALGVRQTGNVLRLARRLAEEGAAVIMITHDVDSVQAVADQVVVLNLGRVVFDGPADTIDAGQMIHLMAGYGV